VPGDCDHAAAVVVVVVSPVVKSCAEPSARPLPGAVERWRLFGVDRRQPSVSLGCRGDA
jgi:hypothetical protein